MPFFPSQRCAHPSKEPKPTDHRAFAEGDGPYRTHFMAAVAANTLSIIKAQAPVDVSQSSGRADGLAVSTADTA